MNYYNEIDPYAAAWLRNLIAAGHIAPGDVDERSIVDVKPDDLAGYTQCHFFAGIGVWSYALRRAGWPDDKPIWTGSCPCQPFSAAGKRGGTADERHLWPAWFHLIENGKPRDVPVLGEQVASKDGLAWLDLVHADLEGQGYSVGALDLCAAGVGAPHIRQRLFFVADRDKCGSLGERERDSGGVAETGSGKESERDQSPIRAASRGTARSVADPGGARAGGHAGTASGAETCGDSPRGTDGRGSHAPVVDGAASELAYAVPAGRPEGRTFAGDRSPTSGSSPCILADAERQRGRSRKSRRADASDARQSGETGGDQLADSGRGIMGHPEQPGSQGCERSSDLELYRGTQPDGSTPTAGFWSDAVWLPCIDGKARPVEPGTFPLAHGAPARVGRLRAYGNAIVAPLATEFVAAYRNLRGLDEVAVRFEDLL